MTLSLIRGGGDRLPAGTVRPSWRRQPRSHVTNLRAPRPKPPLYDREQEPRRTHPTEFELCLSVLIRECEAPGSIPKARVREAIEGARAHVLRGGVL